MGDIPKDVATEIESELPSVAFERYGTVELLELLAQALDGKVDILPRAVANKLTKARRREDERAAREKAAQDEGKFGARLEVVFRRPGDADETPDMFCPTDVMPDGALDRELAIESARKKNPKLRRFLDALRKLGPGATQAELANFLGVTDRTVRTWHAELLELLGPELRVP